MGRKLVTLTCALALLTAGCWGDDGDDTAGPATDNGTAGTTGAGTTTTEPPPPPPPPPTTPTPTRLVDPGCTDSQRQRLRVVLASNPGQAVSSDIVPCTDGILLTLHNTGTVVWRITAPGSVLPTNDEDEASQIFRAAFPLSGPLLPPGQTVLLIRSSTAAVTWTPDFALSGSWLLHKHAYDLVQQYRDKRLPTAFQQGSPRRAALVTCVQAGYTTYKTYKQPPSDKVNALLAGWGLGTSYGSCRAQWRLADAVDDGNQVAHASWEREVAYWARDAEWHGRTSKAVSLLEQASGIFRAFWPK